ncbi:MAG: cyclopropane-fatty-acyl-phospholipid synthase family protein [Sphingomonadales bacterium]|nr:cyclopropane-fatty-acyl-phospholipid synthase family protein [Sphingomonadales bacterium]
MNADRRFATGGGLLGRLVAPAFVRVIDQLHKRLATGGIHATLPDGNRRDVGFHAPGPVATVTLHSWMALVRLATSGSVGWYKAWERGEWSSPDPVPLFALFMANAVALGDAARAKGPARLANALVHRLRDNAPDQARDNIAAHYDLGNDFYAAWLDPSMTYSSARFSAPPARAGGVDSPQASGGGAVDLTPDNPSPSVLRTSSTLAKREGELECAQHRKIALLLARLALKPGDRLLEIGCGWGSLAIEAARRGAVVTGLTLSTEQKAWAEGAAADAGVADRVTFRLQDYRDLDERFDAIASVEMVEAVGVRWWSAYLDAIARSLAPGGCAALQFIGIDHRLFDAYARSADFIQAYIFPGGMLLHEPRFAVLASERGLSWQDRDGFGLDYAETLRQWRTRYDEAVGRGALSGFDERFHRLWRYYLMYCEGGFRGGGIDVAQVTMVKS